MKRHHFETLRPVCPVCRSSRRADSPLTLFQVSREENGHILEGVIHCSHPQCQHEYPIIDGIPILVANLRQYVADNLQAITMTRDHGPLVESMLGDCCGPDSLFGQTRQYLSSYTWDHYGDLDPAETGTDPLPGSMLRTLEAGIEATGLLPEGPLLDVGCSVGRGSFALAGRSPSLILGIDLNFSMLRVAAQVLREGTVSYARRRVGIVYDRREFRVDFPGADKVDFWACDASAPPFPASSFAFATALNVLDCVPMPHELLSSLGRILKPSGKLLLSCPYDWASSATPVEAWLGGHSQRTTTGGSSEAVLRALLTPGAHPNSLSSLKLHAERDDLPWHVRLHDRSTMSYRLHLAVATAQPD